MKRVLVTGAAGFVGRHIVEHLLGRGQVVFGFARHLPSSEISDRVTHYRGDLRNKETVESVVRRSRPDIIYHFAGVTKSRNPIDFYYTNVIGTVNLFEAIQKQGLRPTVLIGGSSAVYAASSSRKPITELFNIQPVTHYGASKAAQEMVARRYVARGFQILFTRTFNLIGPGQPLGLACSDFAQQIALAEADGTEHTVVTGSLDTTRDFIDVRDATRAYTLLVESGRPGLAYNVCSQEPVSIRECLNMLLGMARVPLTTTTDRRLMREDDVKFQVGSSARLRRHTGWKPKIPLQQSLKDLLDYWRVKVRSPE